MPVDFTKLFGNGGAVLGPTLSTNFFESRTWIAPQDGIVIVRGMGAGGGGARSYTSATGGYSGSWGCKIVRVKKGDTIGVAIGAGGIGRHGTEGNGGPGGNTVITIGGVQYIAYGGPGGVALATGPLPNGPSPSANWDFGAASVRPGWAAGQTGGAGVDILAQGNNATTSASTLYSGGGGTGAPGNGGGGGGAMSLGRSGLGSGPSNPAVTFDASQGEWGISFYGGSGNSEPSGMGGNGGGGGVGGGTGGNGGGGGANGSGPAGEGGIGGGGGSVGGGEAASGGLGGQGFAHLKFFADMGV